jgi:ferrous iron transport protein B
MDARDQSLAHLKNTMGDDAETVMAEARYGYISGLVKDVVKKPAIARMTFSDKIDKVLLNRWLGIPIFAAIMYGVFWLTFYLTPPMMDWIETGVGWLAEYAAGIGGWFGSFLSEGVIGGVGSVLVFVPPIFMLFILLAILEDVGYLSRAAFVMDRLMHKIGLHGRSFVPMILGFGCNIPAIMATRTIENENDRLTTILVNPFMSCGARLPIYVFLVAAFFPQHQGLVVFSLYVIGIIVAIVMAKLFRATLFKGESGHFVMELPPYRMPKVKGTLIHMWERGKVFIIRAGTIIFGVVVLIWLLNYVGALEPIGRAIAPIFGPCGFGYWPVAVGLIFGFLAKEVVIGTMGVLFIGAEEVGGLGSVIGFELGMGSLAAFSLMLFTLLYVPCVAALGAVKTETNSWKWTIFTAVYTTVLAWIVAMLVYQIGRLF